MTSTGPGSSTVPKNVAGASYGSTRSALPAIWLIWWCAANAVEGGLFTKRRSSIRTRSAPVAAARPWLGINTNEGCNHPSRLLIRTASNAYFPQIVSALSLPDRGSAVEGVVRDLWDDLQIVDDAADLAFIKKKPKVAEALAPYQSGEILETIGAIKRGHGGERPVKQVELEALLRAPEGFGDDVPIDPDFHARRLPDAAWRRSALSALALRRWCSCTGCARCWLSSGSRAWKP